MSSTFEGVDSYTKSFKEIRKNEQFESTKDLQNKMAVKYHFVIRNTFTFYLSTKPAKSGINNLQLKSA